MATGTHGNPLVIAASFWKKKLKSALEPLKGTKAGSNLRNADSQLSSLDVVAKAAAKKKRLPEGKPAPRTPERVARDKKLYGR